MRHRPNPSILNVDVEELGAGLVGITGSGWVNDFVLARLVDYVVPTLAQHHAIRKAVDGGTTLISAWGLDLAFRFFHEPEWGKWAQFGGSMLGLARLVSAVIPGYQLSSVTPVDSEVGNILSPNHPTKQLQAAQQQAALTMPTGTATTTYTQIAGAGGVMPGGNY